jgi:hypothetical protein
VPFDNCIFGRIEYRHDVGHNSIYGVANSGTVGSTQSGIE